MKHCKDCSHSEDYDPKCKTFFCNKNCEWGEEQDEDASIMCDDFDQRKCDVCVHKKLCYTGNILAWAKKAHVEITIDAQKCIYFEEKKHETR